MKQISKIYFFFWMLILYIPLITLVIFSFNSSKYITKWQGFTVDNYSKLLMDSKEFDFLTNSITITILALIIIVPISVLSCLTLLKSNKKVKTFINSLTYLQIIIPEIIMGLSMAIFFSLFDIKLSMTTVIIAHITFGLAFFSIVFISQLDNKLINYLAVSRDLGASKSNTIKKVLTPLIIKPIISSTFLVSAISLDNYIISLFTSGASSTTYPIYIFASIRQGISPVANAGAVILIILTFTTLYLGFKMFLNIKFKKNEL